MRARRARGAAERGKPPARKLKRARHFLAADAGVGDEDIAASIGVGGSTVYRTRRRFVESSLDLALSEDPRRGAERKLAGKQEALLAATACSSPPAGRARWTLELLADALVKVTTHESLSRETAPRRLAENKLKPWRKDMGCIPHLDADYVARMEDVLDLYAQPPDPKRPVVCFDESPIELIGETRLPIPAKPGQIERYDCEHRRNGTANLFVFLDGNRPGRKGKVTERRAAEDFATCMARTRRGSLSRGGAHPRGARQSVDPFARRPPPDLSGQRSLTGAASTGVPLCPQARKLAEQGGDRDRRPGFPMPRPAHRKLRAPRRRNRRLGEATQRRARPHQVDGHNPKKRAPKWAALIRSLHAHQARRQRVVKPLRRAH